MRRQMQTMAPARPPTIAGLFWDGKGLLWVAKSAEAGGVDRMTAIDGAGRLVAEVQFDAPLRVHSVDTQCAIGTRLDSVGREHLVVYRFR
jgi:hypothetical protein